MLCPPQPPLSPYDPALVPCDCATCPPDLFADGGIAAGSLPILSGVNFGGNPLLPNGCGPLMDAYGPQADVLITNTTECSFLLDIAVNPAGCYFSLDPGASLSLGWVAQSTGINMAPVPMVFPGIFYAGVNETNLAASPICGVNADSEAQFPPFITLTPGDFLWVSIITVLYITGAGPSTFIAPIDGTGAQIRMRGLRL